MINELNENKMTNQINEKLIEAAKSGDLDQVRALIKEGADIHAWDDVALRWAASNGHLEVVKLLEMYK